jgi:hypothetical protein
MVRGPELKKRSDGLASGFDRLLGRPPLIAQKHEELDVVLRQVNSLFKAHADYETAHGKPELP